MALIAEDGGLSLMPPGASCKNTVRGCAGSIRRAPKESLRDVVMLCGMTAAFTGGASISARSAVKYAVADGAALDHVCLGS